MKQGITTDCAAAIKSIIRKYCEHLYVRIHSDEMTQYLQKHELPKLTINKWKIWIAYILNKLNPLFKNFQTEISRLMLLLGNSIKCLNEQSTSGFHSLFQNIEWNTSKFILWSWYFPDIIKKNANIETYIINISHEYRSSGG